MEFVGTNTEKSAVWKRIHSRCYVKKYKSEVVEVNEHGISIWKPKDPEHAEEYDIGPTKPAESGAGNDGEGRSLGFAADTKKKAGKCQCSTDVCHGKQWDPNAASAGTLFRDASSKL